MLAEDILVTRRKHFIEKVKKPLKDALTKSMERRRFSCIYLFVSVWKIIRLVNKYPEPIRENCTHPKSLILLDIRDRFLSYLDLPLYKPMFRALFRLVIVTIEHAPEYRSWGSWIINELVKAHTDGRWTPLEPWLPAKNWIEPCRAEAWGKLRNDLMEDIRIKSEELAHGYIPITK